MPEKTVEIENCIRALEDVVADRGLLSPSMQAILSSTVTHLQDYKKILDAGPIITGHKKRHDLILTE